MDRTAIEQMMSDYIEKSCGKKQKESSSKEYKLHSKVCSQLYEKMINELDVVQKSFLRAYKQSADIVRSESEKFVFKQGFYEGVKFITRVMFDKKEDV